jgi:cell division protein FtsI (penicillin-binding protein 3)
MSENLKNTVLRFAIVFAVITLLFVVVFVRIIVLQTAQRDKWEGVVNREDNYKPIKAIRGSIYDCEGRLLASSVPQYRIFMDTRVEALHMDKGDLFWDHVDSIANGLSRIVGDQTKEEYRKRMVDAYRRGKIVRLTNERISYTQLKEIKRLPLVCRGLHKSGFYAEDLNLRVKPFNSLGSRAIGNIYAASGEAKSGLEMRFDSYLRGEDGMSVRQKIAGGWQNVPIREAVNGCDVYTTFDANLMDICETALRERLELRDAEWGCVVLMDVQTGEIKAMSNLDRAKDGSGYYEMANHAVVRMEPGSTFKTISLMAALDDGKVKMKDTIRVEHDGWWYHGAKHTDAHPSDTVYTIRQAMAVSSNIALAKIVTDGYNGSAKKFVKKLKSWMKK